jgi:hypothetical protein
MFGFRRSRLTTSDLFVNFLFRMRFFLHETDADWLCYSPRDIFIDFALLPKLMRIFQSSTPPRDSFAALGNCVPLGYFLQGTASFLLSQFAVIRPHR